LPLSVPLSRTALRLAQISSVGSMGDRTFFVIPAKAGIVRLQA